MTRCRYCGLPAATTVQGRDGGIPVCSVHEDVARKSLASAPRTSGEPLRLDLLVRHPLHEAGRADQHPQRHLQAGTGRAPATHLK